MTMRRRWLWAVAMAFALALALPRAYVRFTTPAPSTQAAAVPPKGEEFIEAPDGSKAALQAPTTEPTREVDASAQGATEIQLCGGDWVGISADGAIDDDAFGALGSVQDGRKAVAERLRVSDSELAQAALLALSVQADGGRTASAGIGAEALEQLTHRAVATQDPQLYGLALHSCESLPTTPSVQGGSCAMLSAEQWSRLDPGNAWPWLDILRAAVERKDTAARDEALHRIGTSERLRDSLYMVPALIIDLAPKDDRSLLAVTELVDWATALQAAGPLVRLHAFSSSCSKSSVRADSNLWQVCSAAAELLAKSTDSLLAHSMGISIGHRLGWPVERVDRLKAELVGWQLAGSAEFSAQMDHKAASCKVLRSQLERVRQSAALGEIGALKELRLPPGATTETLLAQAQTRRQRLDEEDNDRATPASATASAPVTIAHAASAAITE